MRPDVYAPVVPSSPLACSASAVSASVPQPVVETFSISGMGHGLAVNPGSGTDNCGATGAYFLSYICSSYYTATFWGLNSTSGSTSPSASASASASPSPSASASASASPSASASASPSASASASPSSTYATSCYTASNYAQTTAGRAYQSGGYAYADGSNQNMGLWNTFYVTSLEETSPGYYIIVSSCP